MSPPRRSGVRGRVIALVYGAMAIAFLILVRADPSNDSGWFFYSSVVLAVVGLYLSLIAGLYAWLERRAPARAVMLVMPLAASLLGALMTALAYWIIERSLDRMPPLFEIALNGVLNGALLLGLYVFTIRQPALLEEADALRVEAELAALRSRFEPHFLLNALNAIAGLVKEHPQKARQTLTALGDLLREALQHDPAREHTVEREVAWLRSYVAILEARYGEALSVTWRLDPGAEPRRIPHLLVQPLIENAVLHGIAASSSGRLDLTFEVDADDSLVVRLVNTGPAVSLAEVREGNGLMLVRRRLALEAQGATFVLAPDGAGTRAELRFPHGTG